MNDVLSLSNLASLIRRRWFLFLFFLLLGPAFGFGVASGLPKTYEAQATILVVPKPGAETSAYPAAQFAEKQAGTFPYLADSPAVLDAVKTQLGLTQAPSELRDAISATNVVGTPVIQVQAAAATGAGAAELANAAAEGLSKYAMSLNAQTNRASTVDVQVVTPALPPASPATPRRILFLLVGLLLGAGLGAAAAVILEARTRRRAAEAAVARRRRGGGGGGDAAETPSIR